MLQCALRKTRHNYVKVSLNNGLREARVIEQISSPEFPRRFEIIENIFS